VSGTPGTARPGPSTNKTPLFKHALRLHRQNPDEPLWRGGRPYPDEAAHRGLGPGTPLDRHLIGLEPASVLDAYFARPSPHPRELADAFHELYIPYHRNEHLSAAALRADGDLARRTARWLVRHGADSCAVAVGLAMLAAVGTAEDIPLIRTIGLLEHFGALAADALEPLPGGTDALLWLGDRVTGWGRVDVVEKLCRLDDPAVRHWLLRRACEGHYLDRYFAGKVATVARLHEALGELAGDSGMVDHVGRLLDAMCDCLSMGIPLSHYPHTALVLDAHVRAASALSPTAQRYFTNAVLAQHLCTKSPEDAGCTAEQQAALLTSYLSLLDRDEWVRVAVEGLAAEHFGMRWLADHRAPELRLRAFPDRRPEPAG
jgi:hypothetical protein